jgi:putative tricarboxylic transport membrane protein
MSKTPEEFGKGCNAGVVASETANNAAIGGAMIPLLALGIPGDAVTGLLLGAFTMKGVQPGPLMFTNDLSTINFIFLAMLIANFIMLIANYFSIPVFIRLLKVPKKILFPVVGFLCVLGVYGLNSSSSDLILMLVFGIVGFFMKKWGLKAQPFIIGILVGYMAEQNFRKAMMYSSGSFAPFFTSYISLAFLIVAFASIIFTIYQAIHKKSIVIEDD